MHTVETSFALVNKYLDDCKKKLLFKNLKISNVLRLQFFFADRLNETNENQTLSSS